MRATPPPLVGEGVAAPAGAGSCGTVFHIPAPLLPGTRTWSPPLAEPGITLFGVVVLQSLSFRRDLVIDFPQRWHVQACRFGKHRALMRLEIGPRPASAPPLAGRMTVVPMARFTPAKARLAFPRARYALRGVNQRLAGRVCRLSPLGHNHIDISAAA